MGDIKELWEQRQKLTDIYDEKSEVLGKYPKEADGRHSDNTRAMKGYQEAVVELDKAFQDIRRFNEGLTSKEKSALVKYKREMKGRC